MESPGLAKELVSSPRVTSGGSKTKRFQAYSSIIVPSGSNFSGSLALPLDHPPSEVSVTTFMHPTLARIDQELIAVIAARIERGKDTDPFVFQSFLTKYNRSRRIDLFDRGCGLPTASQQHIS
jgi:hypothetical protein